MVLFSFGNLLDCLNKDLKLKDLRELINQCFCDLKVK